MRQRNTIQDNLGKRKHQYKYMDREGKDATKIKSCVSDRMKNLYIWFHWLSWLSLLVLYYFVSRLNSPLFCSLDVFLCSIYKFAQILKMFRMEIPKVVLGYRYYYK